MKINEIKISGLGGIDSLELSFDDQMNILCGPNGIGKTTVLDAIANSFSGGARALKRSVRAESASVETKYTFKDVRGVYKLLLKEFSPRRQEHDYSLIPYAPYLLSFKTNRVFGYYSLESITKDPDVQDNVIWEMNKNGITSANTKNWFVNRFLYSAHEGAINDAQRSNLELAKRAISVLDKDFSFSRVDAASNDIMVNTPTGEIYYEYLSSGFKSCISIIFAIIREVEFRFTEQRINADHFEGVILIDELELHLHPTWQSKIADLLTSIFPLAQFIVSTHSPHIIQAASPTQLKVLERDNGVVRERVVPTSIYGFRNWTLDEVLTDVMGMEDTRSKTFNKMISDFELAIDEEKYEDAASIFDQLDTSLHPNNHARKLLKLQLASIANNQE